MTNQQTWSIAADELESVYLQSKQCQHQFLPQIAGIGHTDFYQLDHHLSYIETNYKPSKNLSVLSRNNLHEPRMVVTLSLKGHSSFKSNGGDEVIFREGFTTITTFNSSFGKRVYEPDNETLQLRFAFDQKWASDYLDEQTAQQFFNKNGVEQISLRPISAQGISAAQQLLTCNLNHKVKHLFMQGQAMILLANELNHLVAGYEDSERFNLRDQDMARLAKDILTREFKNPPSVYDLAKRIGVNQFKLKQLFHHYFNNTPYGVLLEIRMNHAYKLLETTRCQVSMAADCVGYQHASNFSAAFIKYFGFSPKYIAKTGK